jgi:phage shock protein A
MGIFSRMTDIINANLNSLLDKAEDPAKTARLIIQEMEDTLVEVRSTAVRTIARKKELQRLVGHWQGEAAEWQRKAELALSKDREDLARAALAARTRAQDQARSCEKELKHVDGEIEKLDEDTSQLKTKLADARARQKAITLRAASADSRLKVRKSIDDGRVDEAIRKFEEFESRIEGVEAQAEAYKLGKPRTLKDEIAALEPADPLDAELEQLRQKLGKGAPPPDADKK